MQLKIKVAVKLRQKFHKGPTFRARFPNNFIFQVLGVSSSLSLSLYCSVYSMHFKTIWNAGKTIYVLIVESLEGVHLLAFPCRYYYESRKVWKPLFPGSFFQSENFWGKKVLGKKKLIAYTYWYIMAHFCIMTNHSP